MWPICHISVACHGIHVHQPLASIPSIPIMAAVLCCPRYTNVLTRPDPQRADWKCAAISSSVSSGVSPTIFTQYKSSGEEDIVHWLGARLELAPCELKRMCASYCQREERTDITSSIKLTIATESLSGKTYVHCYLQMINEMVSIRSQ